MNGATTPWTRWISYEEVHDLYAKGISLYGGTGSKSKDGCVDGALGAAYSGELYSATEVDGEYVVSGLPFCGFLLYYLGSKHCFVDGNKRVAWLSATTVLLKMGLTLNVTDAEAEAFCLEIASGNIESADAVRWVADHLKAIE
jgi:death-on-curing protein